MGRVPFVGRHGESWAPLGQAGRGAGLSLPDVFYPSLPLITIPMDACHPYPPTPTTMRMVMKRTDHSDFFWI